MMVGDDMDFLETFCVCMQTSEDRVAESGLMQGQKSIAKEMFKGIIGREASNFVPPIIGRVHGTMGTMHETMPSCPSPGYDA